MFLSKKEREARYQSLRQHMTDQGLDALIVRGSSAIRGEGASFRFLTDFPNINIPLVLFFFREGAEGPIMLVESRFQAKRAKKYSWIDDVRLSFNFLESVLEILKEKRLGHAAVGTDGLDKLPFLWCQKIEESFPDLRLTDFGPTLKELRAYRTPEEIRLVKKSAALVDLAFTEGIKHIKPGKTEWEVIAQMDFVLKSHGVEKSFNIISQGPEVDAYPPSGRKIGKKGMVFVELTACYGGYWTQLARALSLGKPDKTLVKLHQASVQAIREALKYLKPGFKVSKPMTVMEEYVRKLGMDYTPIYGHIVGLDMVEDRPSPKNQTKIAPNMVFIVHPCPALAKSSLLWGETYLTTERGNLRLNRVGDELIVL
ncbi:MAG: Xaa-Pro peptidase family protein [Deltaproteobacteria bacterium]|nr:Xaa-Pro peptidase family protein [Deltaproteobacteria bacterium]